MDEILRRFPHIGDKILKKLDFKSLINFKEVNRSWKQFMKEEIMTSSKTIKNFTNCSDKMMFDVIDKIGSAFILSSVLEEIFKKFPKRTTQNNRYRTFNMHVV